MHATKAAVEGGIVPGGGVALLRASKSLEELKVPAEQQVGVNIIRRALEEPIRQIAENAGWEGSVVVSEVKNKEQNFGFNAQSEKYEDMVKAGVIDPAKVVKAAIQNASSIAGLMLTTEALVNDIPKEDNMPAMPPQPPMY
jgi:chaperonin GroEL